MLHENNLSVKESLLKIDLGLKVLFVV